MGLKFNKTQVLTQHVAFKPELNEFDELTFQFNSEISLTAGMKNVGLSMIFE